MEKLIENKKEAKAIKKSSTGAVLQQFEGFSKLDYKTRLNKLKDLSFLDSEDISYLQSGGIKSPDLAEELIENVLGFFEMPLGVAVNFVINKKDYVLPLAVEETSIVAAASKTARWICSHGEIKTEVLSRLSIGQIQIAKVKNFPQLKKTIEDNFENWKQDVNSNLLASMSKRGGGLKAWELRSINRPDSKTMAVLHLHIETCDAMGANLINQVCEYLKTPLEDLSGEQVTMCILSNLADKRIVRAQVIVKNQELNFIQKVEEASLFAELDPYRAATNNKGIMNGIDALLIATGNDWRAVEAGLHAYAAFGGAYSSLTKWRVKGNELHGLMEAPFMLGTVGGVTDIHPTAKLCLKILGFPKAEELASLCCALGLVQNLGAIRALVTEGVIEGHMKLHIKNLIIKTGATEQEKPLLEQHLMKTLKQTKRLSFSQALKDLNHWRKTKQWQKDLK